MADSAKRVRGYLKGSLTRAASFVETIGPATTLEMLEIKISKLEETWSEFTTLQRNLLELTTDDEECKKFDEEYAEYEETFYSAHSGLKKAIRERQVLEKRRETTNFSELAKRQCALVEQFNSAANVHLPKLTISPFTGNYKDWPSFRDSFMAIIEKNPNLSDSQKFQYLKSYLREDAENLIKHLVVSDANYVEAWDRLEKRYDRTHLIVQSFIQSFVSLPTVVNGNLPALRRVTDGADEVIRGLNALESNSRDPWLIFLLLNKLDLETKQSWAHVVGSRDNCTFDELLEFLQERCNALESCQSHTRSITTRNKSAVRSHVVESSKSSSMCPKCDKDHILPQCPQFVTLDVTSRREFVKSKSLCFNCLRKGHSASKCHSSFRCRSCRSRHHSLVHPVEQQSISPLEPSNPVPQSSHQPQPSHHVPSSTTLINNHADTGYSKLTILPTIFAKIHDAQGKTLNCRVLIDTGSQVSFISESFAQRLRFPRKHARLPIFGVSSTEAGHTKGCITLKLQSRLSPTSLLVEAFVISKVTSNLPPLSIDVSNWSYLQNLELADPNFNLSGPIDVLLGADKVWQIIQDGQFKGPTGLPIAQRTSFGWIVSGEVLDAKMSHHSTVSVLHSMLDTDTLLQRFWEIEEVPPPSNDQFDNDEAEQHFRRTFSRTSDGRYVVQLPFKSPKPIFGSSLTSAVSRLQSMERRFQKDAVLQDMYKTFMLEYINLGHMTKIPNDEIDTNPGQHFYLPHHAVLKPASSTTKLRVVFDGSAHASCGNSLNSQLLVGPPIQRDLFGVCLRFRQHKYVFTTDVVKMFRQIWIDDHHTDFQRIVWRQNPSDEISHFRLRTVTYGTASAPFLSVRVLKQLAMDYQGEYPNAANTLLRDVYVDDIMTGANSIEDLVNLKSELVALLSLAKFELRKWNSNCWPLLSQLPREHCEYSLVDQEHLDGSIKVLGMNWNPTSDEYSFQIANFRLCNTPTRRTLLSEIARIFDPLGFLAPSVILFKLLFQELWSSQLNLKWDDQLPPRFANRWTTYQSELIYLEKIRIKRHLFSSTDEIELHGFSDASSVAYAAVVYARCKISADQYNVVIVSAKTKVAPLKPVSIPRLELCGALLLSRLLNSISLTMPFKVKIFAWCDSQIVLHWLSSPPRRWNTFVANRTADILERIPRYNWNYIASESNPADCASRGVSPSQLYNHQLWWNGPTWLSMPQELWPKTKFLVPQFDEAGTAAEERPTFKEVFTSTLSTDILAALIQKISSWPRLIRVLAYCIRFLNATRNIRTVSPRRRKIMLDELRDARIRIQKYVQNQAFSGEIDALKHDRNLPAKSRLLRYNPFLDSDGVLRVGGRIKHCHASFNIKHPIIMPNNNVSFLIVKDIHETYLHPGASETFVILRQQYWVLGSRNLTRKVVHMCKKCFLHRRTAASQLMGDLPQQRVTPSRPFTHTGCDYAGPLSIKLSRGRSPRVSKAYIALFVCMSTKAIHLELVCDLTTEAFLAAFRRFISRRGKCAKVYSDNGTNFQGARRYLNEMQELVLSKEYNEDIAAALAVDGIEWSFIPPFAPHFGGLWEAGVRSVKLHLRRVIGSTLLTFEELYTVLTQIEAILNSRPLCALSDEDLNPLTPAHFLIGEPYTAIPEQNHLETPANRLSHWNYLQAMVQGFWKRWRMEYITTLQERSKWQTKGTNIKVGDIVVIKELNIPPTKWLLGKVEKVHTGQDNLVRVATVKTKHGQYIRPITKLAVLPLS